MTKEHIAEDDEGHELTDEMVKRLDRQTPLRAGTAHAIVVDWLRRDTMRERPEEGARKRDDENQCEINAPKSP